MLQVQLDIYTSEMPEQHCLTIYLHVITMANFIIRIEDTDQKRNIEDGEKSQLENLAWLGIDWDESPANPGEYGPYRQSERGELYQPLIDQLLASNRAYKCYCTEEELEAEREEQRERGENASLWRKMR
mgnify:CR=1 FL=1